jgi:hypothetical protein
MNETEWLCSTDPTPMLEFLWGKASDRKLRLFACACCRRVWHLISNERSRTVVEVAERYADALASPDALVAARTAAPFYEGHLQEGPIHIFACDAASNVGLLNPRWAAAGAATETLAAVRDAPWIDNRSAPEDFIDAHGACVDERNTQASLLLAVSDETIVLGHQFEQPPGQVAESLGLSPPPTSGLIFPAQALPL